MKLGETQSFASPEAALEHYGIKGMRWGVRKERTTSSTPPSAKKKAVTRAAVGISSITLAAGAGFVAYKLNQGNVPMSTLRLTSEEMKRAQSFLDAAGGGSEAMKYAEMFLKNARG